MKSIVNYWRADLGGGESPVTSDLTGKLGDFTLVFNGKTPSEVDQREKGFPVLKIKDITESGQFIGHFDSYVENIYVEKFVDKIISVGDTLILNAAHNADYVGSKICFTTVAFAGALATGEWLIVRPNTQEIDPQYVHFWIQTARTRRRIKDAVRGIHLYPKDVADLLVSFPPLPEQKRIATVLEKAARLRRLRRYARELSDTYLQSVFLEMFGDPVKNTKKWNQENFGGLLKLKSGNFLNAATMDNKGKYSVYGGNGINGMHSDYMFKERKIVIGRVGVYCGAVHYTKPYSWVTDNALYVHRKDPRLLDLYTVYLLRYLNLNRYSSQFAQPLISEGRLEAIALPIPTITLQEQFVRIVQQFERLQSQQREGERQAEHLFQTLLHGAFRGQLTAE